MNRRFNGLEVSRALGVAPATAGIIAGLLSGTVNPDNFRSVEYWSFSELEAPPQHKKVLTAIAELLEIDEGDIRVTKDEAMYLELFPGQPTVVWSDGGFSLREV